MRRKGRTGIGSGKLPAKLLRSWRFRLSRCRNSIRPLLLPVTAGNGLLKSVLLQRSAAFTIMEVTIAMLLASISVSIAYTSYRMISRSYQQYDQKNRKIAESMLLDKLLKRDFIHAEKITANNDGLTFSYPAGEIYYAFRTGYILRDQAGLRRDTFFLQPANLHRYFRNTESFSGELIDRVDFTTELSGLSMLHRYTRLYSAEELIGITNNQ